MPNLVSRVLTAAVAVPGILWLLYAAPRWGFALLAGAAALVAMNELSAMTLRGRPGLAAWAHLAALLLFVVFAWDPSSRWLPAAVLASTLGGLVAGLAGADPIEGAHHRIAALIAGPLYAALPLAALVRLHALPDGGSWVILSMALAWVGDTAAYFAGRAFGRHPLSRVSPKKTWEGALGGLAGSVAAAVAVRAWLLEGLPLVDAIVLGAAGGALGQVGDLSESLIKRSAGVKDSGWIIPGHGGILDRIDALLFTGAATWLYATWLHGA